MRYSRLVATGDYLPEKVLSNADLERMVDTSDAWIMKRAGIRKRHLASLEQPPSFMAHEAAKLALAKAGWESADLDMIIVATASPDKYFPSCACLLHNKMQLAADIPAFDVNAACSGFIYALSIADQYIKTGSMQRILVVGVDALSRMIDWTDRRTCVLFGDGAGAVLLEAATEPGILATKLHANGSYESMLYADNPLWNPSEQQQYLQMDGQATFKVAVTKLGEMVDEILATCALNKSDIDWLIPHQANQRIIQAVAKKLQLTMDDVVLTLSEHGNTSAASIPLALNTAICDGRVQRGQHLLLEAFGAGFSWGAALLRY